MSAYEDEDEDEEEDVHVDEDADTEMRVGDDCATAARGMLSANAIRGVLSGTLQRT